jgi:hypothetical protein
MPSHISPLDGNYISLKRAALLIAREQSGIEPDEIMDTFKHALFSREFERQEIAIERMPPTEDWNLPLLRIEAPPPRWSAALRLPIDRSPQEYFAVKGPTVADVLGERDALPGRSEDWAAFTGFPREAEIVDEGLSILALIPFATFPAVAQAILGDIMLAKIKLRAWMEFKGYELPRFLEGVLPPTDCEDDTGAANSAPKASRGRPRKPGWELIEKLVIEMHAVNPATPLGTLAFDAWKRAAAEFPREELPSWETVLRHMKAILSQTRSPKRSIH